jgi:predicted nucleic-acid-binding protein
VRLIVGDDAKQTASAERFANAGAWVSHLVLVEATWVLRSLYGFDPARIATTVEMLLEQDQIAVEEPRVVTAALALFREQPRLGFSDCLILEVARQAGHLPLGTFDRKLGKILGAHRL